MQQEVEYSRGVKVTFSRPLFYFILSEAVNLQTFGIKGHNSGHFCVKFCTFGFTSYLYRLTSQKSQLQ